MRRKSDGAHIGLKLNKGNVVSVLHSSEFVGSLGGGHFRGLQFPVNNIFATVVPRYSYFERFRSNSEWRSLPYRHISWKAQFLYRVFV